jgi:hypothetical protein
MNYIEHTFNNLGRRRQWVFMKCINSFASSIPLKTETLEDKNIGQIKYRMAPGQKHLNGDNNSNNDDGIKYKFV